MRSARRLLSAILTLLVPLATDGCASVRVTHAGIEGDGKGGAGAGVAVSIFETAAHETKDTVVATPVFSQLLRLEKKGHEREVARSMTGRWALQDVPAGDYRVRLTKRIDEHGDVVPLASVVKRDLHVEAGEKADVRVVLKKVPVVWIVVAAITLIVLIILSVEWAKEGKIPVPPPPRPLPFPVPVAIAADFTSRPRDGVDRLLPGVADVFPGEGAIVAARRVTVSFLITVPLEAGPVDSRAVSAVGSISGDLGGAVVYRVEEQLVQFTPDRDFSPGETVTVTLDLAKVKSADGTEGKGRVTTRFKVPVSEKGS